jgi:hypothetical protein
MERTVAHVLLTIETGSDPIAGSIASPGQQPHNFSGWVELAEAIEHARRSAEPDSKPAERLPGVA